MMQNRAQVWLVVTVIFFGVTESHLVDAAPPRVKDGAELYDKCRNDPVYCDETFDTYRAVYAIMVIPELRNRPENREIVQGYEDRGTFSGICLPRDRLFDEKFAEELSKLFLAWAKPRRESLIGLTSGEAVRQLMQARFPCQSQ
ncbi:MAG: hypothetical protein R3E60_03515 [Alphaproteobacteria bacterium]